MWENVGAGGHHWVTETGLEEQQSVSEAQHVRDVRDYGLYLHVLQNH